MSTDVKNYNINSILGVDDLEVTRALKISDNYAYDTGLNDAAIEQIKENNFRATKIRLLNEGKSLQEAEREAGKVADKGERLARKELAKVRKARNYE